jgi:phage terminase large subunit GpA-like protein
MNLPVMDSRSVLERASPALRVWRAPPRLSVSQWADQNRMLSPESSAEPGRWSTARAEYQRGIMDAIGDPTIREIWVQKSAQVGWTEILGNAVGFYIDQDPSPMLLIQPTLDMAEAWSKDRFAPMLRDTRPSGPGEGCALAGLGQHAAAQAVPGRAHHDGRGEFAASLASRPVRGAVR